MSVSDSHSSISTGFFVLTAFLGNRALRKHRDQWWNMFVAKLRMRRAT